jgi:Triosephosphate isomerase
MSLHCPVSSFRLRQRAPAAYADAMQILYGGSVTPATVEDLLTSCSDVDGCLIGGASLSADSFGRICTTKLSASAQAPLVLYAELAVPCKVSHSLNSTF